MDGEAPAENPSHAPLSSDLRAHRIDSVHPLRDALVVSGGALLCGCVALVSVVVLARRALVAEVQDGLARFATAAAAMVDGDAHSALVAKDQWGGPDYERTIRPLRRLHTSAPSIAYVYTLRLVGDQVHFVLDTAEPGDADHDGVEDHSYLLDPYPEADSKVFVALAESRTVVTPDPFRDSWGTFVSAYAPIFDTSGRIDGLVGIDMDLSDYRARLAGVERAGFAGGVSVLGIVSAIFLVAFRQQRAAQRSREETLALTRALEHAKEEAESASAAKSNFLANISHELRTPMTAIIGFGDILLGGELDHSSAREHVGTICRNAQALLGLINDLLDLSRIDAKRLDLECIQYSPTTLLRDVMQSFVPSVQARGLTLDLYFVSPLPAALMGDPLRLRQILVNVIGNAIKFTPMGSIRVDVNYLVQPTPTLEVSVTDSGIGLTSDQIAQLFRPFVQVDTSTSRQYGGTGLGLALCKRLCQSMGGDIFASSDGQRGSTFRFWIAANVEPSAPLFEAEQLSGAPTRLSPALPKKTVSEAAAGLKGRILLAEDGRDNRILVQRLLARTELELDLAEDGVLALEMVQRAAREGRPYDVLLTDIQMPHMDGLELTRRLRAEGFDLPIVALTAHAMPMHREQCFAAGCSGFAVKPIDPHQLLAALSAALDEPEDGQDARADQRASRR